MARAPRRNWPPQQRAPVRIGPHRRRKRWRLRRDYIVVPLVCLLAGWFIANTRGPACSWNEVMGQLGVHDRNSYSGLALCGLSLIATVALVRVLRKQ
jgi:hypothetical protein